ncbi:YolD-like family protein [Cytobacillus kochii]|uniref:YolD-like family protein n=1 Tax=Cytobacillus kochii TaxID=859143 RepID=UPI00402AA4F4
MDKDRGMKKWQGFFMPEHVQALNSLQREDSKIPRPILSEDQIEEMERVIVEGLEENSQLALTCWKDGFLIKRVGFLKSVDPVNKRIQLFEQDTLHQINFLSVVQVEKFDS